MNESFTGIESPKYFKQTHTYFNPRNDEDEDLSISKKWLKFICSHWRKMKKLEKYDKENGMKGRKREVEGLKEKMKKRRENSILRKMKQELIGKW